MHSIGFTGTANVSVGSTTSLSNLTSTRCQSPSLPRSPITISGTLLGWLRNGTSVGQTCSRQTTARVSRPRLSCRSRLRRSMNLDPMPVTFSGSLPSSLKGADENNIDRLFPTVPRRKNIFDKFCVLSLAYHDGEFITMLAPVCEYLSPRNPMSNPMLDQKPLPDPIIG